MITQQRLQIDDKGNYTLTNTCNNNSALEMARKTRELNPDGHFGDKNGECMIMGYIPEEMWNWHWILKEARKARFVGDKAKYDELLMKFFKLYPAFSTPCKSKYFGGHRAVLL